MAPVAGHGRRPGSGSGLLRVSAMQCSCGTAEVFAANDTSWQPAVDQPSLPADRPRIALRHEEALWPVRLVQRLVRFLTG
jgi:hypothetical protein